MDSGATLDAAVKWKGLADEAGWVKGRPGKGEALLCSRCWNDSCKWSNREWKRQCCCVLKQNQVKGKKHLHTGTTRLQSVLNSFIVLVQSKSVMKALYLLPNITEHAILEW